MSVPTLTAGGSRRAPDTRRLTPRLLAFGIAIILAVSGLGLRLFQLQLAQASTYEARTAVGQATTPAHPRRARPHVRPRAAGCWSRTCPPSSCASSRPSCPSRSAPRWPSGSRVSRTCPRDASSSAWTPTSARSSSPCASRTWRPRRRASSPRIPSPIPACASTWRPAAATPAARCSRTCWAGPGASRDPSTSGSGTRATGRKTSSARPAWRPPSRTCCAAATALRRSSSTHRAASSTRHAS